MKTQTKWRNAILFLLMSFVLGGCGFKDIDKRFFVVSIGVDAAKASSKKYLVSLKFAVPGASKESPSQYQIV
ncbi:hypothetical protein M3226_14400 [Neobacillus cucumis]|uniref:hypothetical protein n=1 Tax=Neobacillus cucumis TaxID=1740721 RepID=UPI00203FDB1C|nr:hypothetical protein [Neobacillus cucumis]MCM3726878.1 hypothetical protein [Neobacillus cucumis]